MTLALVGSFDQSLSITHPLPRSPLLGCLAAGLLGFRAGCEGSGHGVRHVRDGRRHRWVEVATVACVLARSPFYVGGPRIVLLGFLP